MAVDWTRREQGGWRSQEIQRFGRDNDSTDQKQGKPMFHFLNSGCAITEQTRRVYEYYDESTARGSRKNLGGFSYSTSFDNMLVSESLESN